MKKQIAIVAIILIVLNIILFATGVFDALLFWVVIGLVGGFTYFIFPKIQE